MKKYTIEELIELAKTTSGQVAVKENGTFLNAQDYARMKDKDSAILLKDLPLMTEEKKQENAEAKAKAEAAKAEKAAKAEAEKLAKAEADKAEKAAKAEALKAEKAAKAEAAKAEKAAKEDQK